MPGLSQAGIPAQQLWPGPLAAQGTGQSFRGMPERPGPDARDPLWGGDALSSSPGPVPNAGRSPAWLKGNKEGSAAPSLQDDLG